MMVPPNGSAERSGMNESVSSVACQRKELTPIVMWPPACDVMAVEPASVSSIVSSEPQEASRSAAARAEIMRMDFTLQLFSAEYAKSPRRALILAAPARRNGGRQTVNRQNHLAVGKGTDGGQTGKADELPAVSSFDSAKRIDGPRQLSRHQAGACSAERRPFRVAAGGK